MVHEKQVIEEVSGWLRVFEDGSVDRSWTGPPEVKFMVEPVPPHDNYIDGVAVKDVVASDNNDSSLGVRIYLPEQQNDKEKLPVILHFHGGGFCISQADWFMYYTVYTRLARVANSIIVSVFLPLAPEHRLPAACDAGFAALLWLRDLSRSQCHEPWLNEYADFNRVFLVGDSSGGNIVHNVAARAAEEQSDISSMRLAGAIPVHPGFVRSQRSKSELEQEQTPFLTLDMVDKFLKLALPVGSNKDHPITCPMNGAPVEELKLPPYLYCVAEKDLIKDTEMEYYEIMKKGKKDVELFINDGVGHSFYLNKIAVDMDPHTASATTKLFEAIAEFISKH